MIIYETTNFRPTEAANDENHPWLATAPCMPPRISPSQVNININLLAKKQHNFEWFANKALLIEQQKCVQGEITKQTLGMFISRLRSQIIPSFGNLKIEVVQLQQIAEFVMQLQNQAIRAITIKQYLGLVRRILQIALDEEAIYKMPSFPKLKSKSVPRGSFSISEYRAIYSASRSIEANVEFISTHRSSANGAFIKRDTVPMEMKWLIRFMVNSFIRPVDIKVIKHKHIEIITGAFTYLRLNLPETKRHRGQVVTMVAAKRVYETLMQHQKLRGYGSPDDYVFLPEAKDRSGAIQLITTHFRKILDKAGLRKGQYGQSRTIYSLRHTAITFRLLYGNGIDLLTLARNARTSVEMIERFYSSNLMAEMNIEMLHSKRTKPFLTHI